MADRHRHRPRSPPLVTPGRSSLPTLSYPYGGDVYAVPTRREYSTAPRSNNDAVPVVTTTYKIQHDIPRSSSTARETGRPRRPTIESSSQPTLVPPSPRHRTSIHGGAGRPSSPSLQNPARSSADGEYWLTPASSSSRHHHHHHHHKHRRNHSATSADPTLRVEPAREVHYSGKPRPTYPQTIVRRPDTVDADYGANGYGYTNVRDLVQYDLNQSAGRGYRDTRPSSISSYGDLMTKPQDQQRGPPPSTRGFDRISTMPTYEGSAVRPMHPIASVDGVRAVRGDPYEPDALVRQRSRSSSLNHQRRPTVYHEERHRPRDEYIETRDHDARDRRERSYRSDRYASSYDDRYGEVVDQKTYVPRSEKRDLERREHRDRERSDGRHSGAREAIATGLSIAAGALGLTASASKTRDEYADKDSREEHRHRRDNSEDVRRRRDSSEDRRRRRDASEDDRRREYREDKETSKEKSRRRDSTSEREKARPYGDDRDTRERNSHSDRSPEPASARSRDDKGSRREKSDITTETQGALEALPVGPALERTRGTAVAESSGASFNPNDPTDLRVLKEALNAQGQQAATGTVATLPERANQPAFNPRSVSDLQSMKAQLNGHDAREEDESTADARGRTESITEAIGQLVRVVSPPREKTDDKPLKGILRAPREKFPEDPAPIREGVAPLKDAKKDGIPPDARWTKVSRQLVNPEALEAGKERYEAREDFVIVLRVLSREEIQAYAAATQQIRAARDEEHDRRRRRRRQDRDESDHVYDVKHRDHHTRYADDSAGSDSTGDERPRTNGSSRLRRSTMDDPVMMSGALDGALHEEKA